MDNARWECDSKAPGVCTAMRFSVIYSGSDLLQSSIPAPRGAHPGAGGTADLRPPCRVRGAATSSVEGRERRTFHNSAATDICICMDVKMVAYRAPCSRQWCDRATVSAKQGRWSLGQKTKTRNALAAPSPCSRADFAGHRGLDAGKGTPCGGIHRGRDVLLACPFNAASCNPDRSLDTDWAVRLHDW